MGSLLLLVMALTIQIAGADRTADLKPNTVSYEDTVNSRNTMRFKLHGKTSSLVVPSDGQEVIFFDGATRLYAGILIEPEQEVFPGKGLKHLHCQAGGYELITDRRVVAAVYENQTFAAIVTDIVNTHLAGEGITLGTVDTGPTLTKVPFNYQTATDALNEVAELAGYSWWIDVNKALQARARTSVLGSTTFDETNVRWFRLKPSRERYRNKQFIRAGVDLTDSRTEKHAGDGKTRAFALKFPVGKVPTSVKVNAVSKTIGIHQVDTGKDFYWNKSDVFVKQDDAGTLLADTDELEVTYQGEFPITVSAQDDAEITTRAAAEGAGTGIYEHVEEHPQIDDADAALDVATAYINRYGRMPDVARFETDVTGVRAGQLITINIPEYGVNGQFLVQRVNASDSSGTKLWFTVEALSGDAHGGWQEYFRTLQQARRKLDDPRDNEVVNFLRTTNEEVYCHDVVNALSAAAVTTVGAARVGFSEVG